MNGRWLNGLLVATGPGGVLEALWVDPRGLSERGRQRSEPLLFQEYDAGG